MPFGFIIKPLIVTTILIRTRSERGHLLRTFISLSKFSSLNFILKKWFFFKQSSTKSFHIPGPLIEILYLALVSFKVGFEKFKVDDLTECRWEILWKLSMKTGGDAFVWTWCINTVMLNILSLYKFSTFVDLKSSVCSKFALLWTIRIALFCWLRSFFSDSLDM